ncbi:MAG: NADH:flavin oxidoreductase/NADH oxidase [Rhodospirillaceae bacterium]|nr:NADH:flavin oxidoreductase/NADH oxidase [Rhodospirillaceae bacterium]
MSERPETPLLFTPLKLREVELPNRVAISPMCQYSANGGLANDWHFQHLGRFAGAGLVFTEATAVEARGRITFGDLGIWSDDHAEALRRITRYLKDRGAVPGIQLAHAGRKASARRPWDGGAPLDDSDAEASEPPWQTVAPSALPPFDGAGPPHALDAEEIAAVVEAWASAALRAHQAGFEVVEIHAAHGYLLHQFLSAVSNRRDDAWGGALEGRMRFPLLVAERVRRVWPREKPVFLRLSASDEGDPSWTMDEVAVFVGELQKRGIDVIDCSSGGIGAQGFAIRGRRVPGFQVGLAEEIRRRTGVRTMGVGLITGARQAEDILQRGRCDLVAIGREALHDPYWALHAARELGVDPDFRLWPRPYGWWLDYRDRTVAPDRER